LLSIDGPNIHRNPKRVRSVDKIPIDETMPGIDCDVPVPRGTLQIRLK
jgi:hypothetical protein